MVDASVPPTIGVALRATRADPAGEIIRRNYSVEITRLRERTIELRARSSSCRARSDAKTFAKDTSDPRTDLLARTQLQSQHPPRRLPDPH